MGKHVYSALVLECTLSTRVGVIERTLPGQETGKIRIKKMPGID